MKGQWTPEALGRVLVEADEGDGDCGSCLVKVECDRGCGAICKCVGLLLEALNRYRVPAPEHALDAKDERIRELEEALAFYADKYNYDIATWGLETPVDVDGGQRARKALGEKGGDR